MGKIAVLGTLDTKGIEHQFVADAIVRKGHEALLIDVGGLAPPLVDPDVSREAVAASDGIDIATVIEQEDRGALVSAMSGAAASYLRRLCESGEIQGVISLGGSGGTAIATTAMRALPVGFPKVMVSTMASGDVQAYVGEKDIVMIPSIVDVAGLNRFSRLIFTRAVGAICGMIETDVPLSEDRPIIVASMFGNTTDCINTAKKALESAGYEVLVFHATGAGGRTMESLIGSGMVCGVLDVTTTEWADELVGGVLGAGPKRLEAAARKGVPTVVSLGCLDMVNFGSPESVPSKFSERLFYHHNPQVTLMRTSIEESREIGRVIAEKLNLSVGAVTVLIPLKGLSVIGAAGEVFADQVADEALFQALRENLREDICVIDVDANVNEAAFSSACVDALLENIKRSRKITDSELT